MAGLYGTYRNSMDPKGRVAIPAKLRNAFPEGQRDKIYITRGIDTCITGYYYDEWQRLRHHLKKVNINEKTKRKLKRQFIGRGAEVSFDKQGRIIIPQDLIDFAGLKDGEVLIIGSDNMIEIWDPDVYEAEGDLSEDVVQETMGSLNLDDVDLSGMDSLDA
jgi:MraZ protein